MLTLEQDRLVIRFPEIHPDAVCTIDFQRTLRIPDDNRRYALPPGLGRFALSHVDDHAAKLPESWRRRGGVFMPMHATEAMWIRFQTDYPFAVKVAAGKINAVTGKPWDTALHGRGSMPMSLEDMIGRRHESGWMCPGVVPPLSGHTWKSSWPRPHARPADEDQDYIKLPDQRWLDGFCVGSGVIRQFVAMPLSSGYTAEEQITGTAEHGGIQILIYPLKAAHYRPRNYMRGAMAGSIQCSAASLAASASVSGALSAAPDLGMGAGGMMNQAILGDEDGVDLFDQTVSEKVFVHLLDARRYPEVTGRPVPHPAPTAADYTNAGLPWFHESHAGKPALPGAPALAKLDSVASMAAKLGEKVLPEEPPMTSAPVIVPAAAGVVRQGDF